MRIYWLEYKAATIKVAVWCSKEENQYQNFSDRRCLNKKVNSNYISSIIIGTRCKDLNEYITILNSVSEAKFSFPCFH